MICFGKVLVLGDWAWKKAALDGAAFCVPRSLGAGRKGERALRAPMQLLANFRITIFGVITGGLAVDCGGLVRSVPTFRVAKFGAPGYRFHSLRESFEARLEVRALSA